MTMKDEKREREWRPPIGTTVRLTRSHPMGGCIAKITKHESWAGRPSARAALIRTDALSGYEVGLLTPRDFNVLMEQSQ